MTFSLTEVRIAKASCLCNEKSCQLQAPLVWKIKMLKSSLVLYFFAMSGNSMGCSCDAPLWLH